MSSARIAYEATTFDAALRLSSRLLRSAGEGFFAVNHELRYVAWNEVMEDISGLRADEVLGRPAIDIFPFFRETGEEAHFLEALQGRPVSASDRTYVVPDTGREGFFDAFYCPIDGPDGEILGVAAIFREVTSRKQAEELLRETEDRFRNMADSSPVMLWMARGDSLCTFFNQTWLDFTGRTMAQEWGVGWAEGIHAEDFQRAMDTYVDAFNERRRFEMEYRLRRVDGTYRWILDRGTPRFTPDGSFAGYIGSCTDIHDRRNTELELRQAVRARDEFLSVASHELKTPLTSLQLQLQMFSRLVPTGQARDAVTQRMRKIVEVADRQIGRMTELIEALLDVSRISAGRLSFNLEEVDLGDILHETVERLEEQLARAGCELNMTIEPGLVGRWDRYRLEQVVVNLLTNVMRYAAGSRVQIEASGNAERVTLWVRDNGPGIVGEELSRIFERFYRSAPSTHFGGLGLGLYIVKHIIDAHGGTIHVESAPGAGAAFRIELPRLPVRGAT